MRTLESILKDTAHRPYAMPTGAWSYYQEWNRALFLHWKVPYEVLRPLVPEALSIDQIEGDCYISLVAFTMEKIRPRGFPAVGFISNFDEINVRTYINNDNKRGVYFLSIEAGKIMSAWIARTLSGLPYQKATMNSQGTSYTSMNGTKGYNFEALYDIREKVTDKTALDLWLTERYCLYLEEGNHLFRYEIHHKEWELNKVQILNLTTHYCIGNMDLSLESPDFMHYSKGVQVVAWKREKFGKK